MQPITIRDFLSFRYVSAPAWAPDGSMAAFVVQHADEAGDRYTGDLWLYRPESGEVRRLTAQGDAKGFCWTADNTLLFSAVRDKADKEAQEKGEPRSVFYEIDPRGGEAVKAFTLPLRGAGLTPLEDGRYIVSATRRPEDDTEDKPAKKPGQPEVFEELPFWSNGEGYVSGQRSALYLYDRSAGDPEPLTPPEWDAWLCHAAHGKLVFQGGPWEGVRYPETHAGLYLCDLADRQVRCLLSPGELRVEAAALLDADTLLLAASEEKEYGTEEYCKFYTLSLADGHRALLADYDAAVGWSSVGSDARLGGGRGVKADDSGFWFISTLGHQADLMHLDRQGRLTARYDRGGSVDSFDVHDGKVLFAGLLPNGLTELYDGDGNQLTHFNDGFLAEHTLSAPAYHRFTASDGYDIEGWAMLPAGYREGERYPAILHIHGGPRTVLGDVYHHEMQVWANAGYFVFYCNPRGSDGGGSAFGDIAGKYGTVDYQNIMEFADEMLRCYPAVDPARFGVTGGSYGGFMTNWIIGHTHRFAAACAQRSIANWVCFEHTSDIGYFFTHTQMTAVTRTDPAKLWEHSPLKYAPAAKTPTLFIHSEEDYRCWMAEGLSMFTALKLNGTPARLVLFHGENHDLSRSGKPSNRIRRMEEILRWFDKYLK